MLHALPEDNLSQQEKEYAKQNKLISLSRK